MNSLRDQLQSIYEQRGKLSPEIVLQEARDEAHPLHSRFEWDNRAAGEAWRRHQAHELIQSVKIVYKTDADGTQHSLRAFHAVRREDGHFYEPVETIARDEFMTSVLLADMEREWKAMQRRWSAFDEFWRLVSEAVAEKAA